MNRFKRINFTKHIGCHHDDEGNLVGGIPMNMVALYDSEKVTEEEAKQFIESGTENNFFMVISQVHYDAILRPAVDEAIMKSKEPIAISYGQILYYYDGEENNARPEKCRVDGMVCDKNGHISEMSLTFFDEEGNETDFDIFGEGVTDYLFESEDDAIKGLNIVLKGGNSDAEDNRES